MSVCNQGATFNFIMNLFVALCQSYRVDSGSEFPGLKTTVFDDFWAVLGAYKRQTPLHIGLLSLQLCTDLRGVKNPWKIGGNPPIGGKESTLSYYPFRFN